MRIICLSIDGVLSFSSAVTDKDQEIVCRTGLLSNISSGLL